MYLNPWPHYTVLLISSWCSEVSCPTPSDATSKSPISELERDPLLFYPKVRFINEWFTFGNSRMKLFVFWMLPRPLYIRWRLTHGMKTVSWPPFHPFLPDFCILDVYSAYLVFFEFTECDLEMWLSSEEGLESYNGN